MEEIEVTTAAAHAAVHENRLVVRSVEQAATAERLQRQLFELQQRLSNIQAIEMRNLLYTRVPSVWNTLTVFRAEDLTEGNAEETDTAYPVVESRIDSFTSSTGTNVSIAQDLNPNSTSASNHLDPATGELTVETNNTNNEAAAGLTNTSNDSATTSASYPSYYSEWTSTASGGYTGYSPSNYSTPTSTSSGASTGYYQAKTKSLSEIRQDIVFKFSQLRVISNSPENSKPISIHRQLSNESHSIPVAPPQGRRSISSSAQVPVRSEVPTCAVCLAECVVQVKNICPESCPGGVMCIACSNKLWSTWLNDSRYVVAPPKCIQCKACISMHRWSTGVRQRELAQFKANLGTPFLMRCPYCDQDCSFLHMEESASAESDYEQKLKHITGFMSNATRFREALEAFIAYVPRSVVTLVDIVEEELGKEQARWALIPSILRTADETSTPAEFDGIVLMLFSDLERRATLQLEAMRRENAQVATVCCGAPVCFTCKNGDGWHEGESCEEVMERMWNETPTDGDKIFQCPSCMVSCVHAGGCSSIRCICGHEYSLNDEVGNLFG